MCDEKNKATTDTSWLGAIVRVWLPWGTYIVTKVETILPNKYGIYLDDPWEQPSRPIIFVVPKDVHLVEKKEWDAPLPNWDTKLVGYNGGTRSHEASWLVEKDMTTGEEDIVDNIQYPELNSVVSDICRWHKLIYMINEPLEAVWKEIE